MIFYPGIRLEGLRKIRNNSRIFSQSPGGSTWCRTLPGSILDHDKYRAGFAKGYEFP
jgi:hypothetical protein